MAQESSVVRAMKWISERLKENESANKLGLVDEASMRFNLSPSESETLLRNYLQN